MFKKSFLSFAVLFMLFILLSSPALCIEAASDGLLLWFNKLLPTLLPFMIFINILTGLNGLKQMSHFFSPFTQKIWHLPGSSLFAFMMGVIAGYPMGAKVVRDLYLNGSLSKSEAEKTLCFTNNCSPLFIIGTVGTIMLKQTSLGYFLLSIHLLSACLMSFILSFYQTKPQSPSRFNQLEKTISLSGLFNESVKTAMDTIVYVGGYIILFSVIARFINSSFIMKALLHSSLFNQIPSTYIVGFVTGLLEFSNGASLACSSSEVTVFTVALVAFIVGFGGLCVHSQTSYVLENCGFFLLPYIISKFMQGILSFILVYVTYPLFLHSTSGTILALPSKSLVILIIFILTSIYIVNFFSNTYIFSKKKSYKDSDINYQNHANL